MNKRGELKPWKNIIITRALREKKVLEKYKMGTAII